MDARELGALLGRHATAHAVPGAALGILRAGTSTTAHHGLADVETGTPVAPETRFSVGSLTKSMVATVVVRLAGLGRLSLDDPVAARVPELRARRWARAATVRGLLANRSGIPLRRSLEFGFGSHADADDGALARLAAEVAGAGPPVDGWSYSNVGWCVLGRVIESATGATWEAAMREHLFEPLGMSATSFAPGVESGSQVSGYGAGPDGFRRIEPPRARAYGPAGTTVVSTTTDVLRFAAAHLADPASAVMRTGQSDVAIRGWLDGWCLGWARFGWDGGPAWGWDGLIGGERSSLRIVPERELAIVLLANGSSGRAMHRSLLAELLPTLGMAAPPLRLDTVAGAAGDLSRFAGTYAWPDRRVQVVGHADGLRITEDGEELDARPLDSSTFVVDPADPDNPTVTFADFDAGGRPRVLYLMLWGLPRVDG